MTAKAPAFAANYTEPGAHHRLIADYGLSYRYALAIVSAARAGRIAHNPEWRCDCCGANDLEGLRGKGRSPLCKACMVTVTERNEFWCAVCHEARPRTAYLRHARRTACLHCAPPRSIAKSRHDHPALVYLRTHGAATTRQISRATGICYSATAHQMQLHAQRGLVRRGTRSAAGWLWEAVCATS